MIVNIYCRSYTGGIGEAACASTNTVRVVGIVRDVANRSADDLESHPGTKRVDRMQDNLHARRAVYVPVQRLLKLNPFNSYLYEDREDSSKSHPAVIASSRNPLPERRSRLEDDDPQALATSCKFVS